MDYNEQQQLRAEAAAGEVHARDVRREATVGEADGLWQAGDRAAALRVLYNAGVDDLVGFCRARGLSEDEARSEIRAANVDWS